jgi:hypothetical protein
LTAAKAFQIGFCGSGELFFASAFLFTASSSCEGGEKRTTAKNKIQQFPLKYAAGWVRHRRIAHSDVLK